MAGANSPTLKPPVSDRDHIEGPADAPVTLVEYGDYECPHCRQVAPIIEKVEARFGNRLRYVFRHFPITTAHPNAQLAAEAAEAAGAQGKFWEMHDRLFTYTGPLPKQQLLKFAAELDLDLVRFERELDEHTHAERIREDLSSGVRSGAHGAPTFFLNGIRYDGAWDLDSLIAEVVLNAVLGFSQEFRAEKAMAALKQLAVPTVKAESARRRSPPSASG